MTTKLIFIYGPPATGKLTVSKELAKLTGYKVFHNHITNDVAEVFFPFGTKEFFGLTEKLRLEILRAALRGKLGGIIVTFCYVQKEDDRLVRRFVRTVERSNGKVYFVHLFSHPNELKKRVVRPSRKRFGKVKSKLKLHAALARWEFFKPIPFVRSLQIDNTRISPREVAQRIKTHYKL
ncbi:hypothetical protein C4571_00880 [Candidatus Parcubacteria bacterium]|nr:MAG: hypothetical protein C4571_00880 [Candidatus Parcubacteria bacterium]